jgi:hypothetical protein
LWSEGRHAAIDEGERRRSSVAVSREGGKYGYSAVERWLLGGRTVGEEDRVGGVQVRMMSQSNLMSTELE